MATQQDYFRFCPGEEHVRISNAICRGRRRSHYPKCPGCQFNDDEKDSAGKFFRQQELTPLRVENQPRTVSGGAIFEKTAPKKPTGPSPDNVFHGQDVYGQVPSELTEDIAWRIGHATAQYLHSKLRGFERADPKIRAVATGRDMRSHGLTLQKALVEGIRSTGLDVVNLGEIDTPQLYFAVTQLKSCGGVHITGGHLPLTYNGFRICGAKGVPIGTETGLASIRDIAVRVPWHKSSSNSRMVGKDVSGLYAKFLSSFVLGEGKLPRKIKIVVDCSNGLTGKMLPLIFKRVRNLELIAMNTDHRAPLAHGLDPAMPRSGQQVRKMVKAKDADFGVCFDGSGARCVFVDDKGHSIRHDLLAALLARMFIEREPGATVVYDHRCSVVTREEIDRAGGNALRERGEGVFIKRIMTERDGVFGADLSGRFYFRDLQCCECGLLALIHVINLLLVSGRKLSDLLQPLQRFATSGDVSIACSDTDQALAAVASMHREASVDLFDGITFRYPDWWFNIRPRHTDSLVQVMVEARSRRLVDSKLNEIRTLVHSAPRA